MGNEISNIKIGTTMGELKAFVENQNNLSEVAKKSIFDFIQGEEECGDKIISNKIELSMVEALLARGEDCDSYFPKVKMPKNIDAAEDNVQIFKYEHDYPVEEQLDNYENFPNYRLKTQSQTSSKKHVLIKDINLNETEIEEIVRDTKTTRNIIERNSEETLLNESSEQGSSRYYTIQTGTGKFHKFQGVSDTLIDIDNDGIADVRIYDINTQEEHQQYIDNNTDGSFDEVYTSDKKGNSTRIIYNDEGNPEYKEVYKDGVEIKYQKNEDGNWVIVEE